MKRQIMRNTKQYKAKQNRHQQRRKAKNFAFKQEVLYAPLRAKEAIQAREQATQDAINKLLGRPG